MNKLYRLRHIKQDYRATADEIRRNQSDQIIAVHIPLIGWRNASEFEIEEETNVDI